MLRAIWQFWTKPRMSRLTMRLIAAALVFTLNPVVIIATDPGAHRVTAGPQVNISRDGRTVTVTSATSIPDIAIVRGACSKYAMSYVDVIDAHPRGSDGFTTVLACAPKH